MFVTRPIGVEKEVTILAYVSFWSNNEIFISLSVGINGYVDVDGNKLHGWEIYPLEFKRNFVDK